jgi:diaminohydroxyphosphoribosylaminopyrimidine deaminase/5-amino-6-(5-phosphoribosylamino)uracil reductase
MEGNHEIYMNRCLELASLGLGNTAPNPMVGSVIVYNNTIIGEGYHRKYGEAHAEVNAINSVENKSLLKESTIYVNLEPCSHYGKTPPCAELIKRMQIPKVVVGTLDPNPLVLGKGIEVLRSAGISVITGILEKGCAELNKRFFTFQKYQRPYIILKWAQTADHFIDKIRDANEKPQWITNQASKILVHKWRSEEQAIMVATNTALMDNPQLNVREWSGKNPVRIVIDYNHRLPSNLKIFDSSTPTIVYTGDNLSSQNENITFVKTPMGMDNISFILNHLYCSKISSVIIEGGAKFLNFLLQKNLWDEARVFEGQALFGEGISAPEITILPFSETDIDGVKLKYYKNIVQTP